MSFCTHPEGEYCAPCEDRKKWLAEVIGKMDFPKPNFSKPGGNCRKCQFEDGKHSYECEDYKP